MTSWKIKITPLFIFPIVFIFLPACFIPIGLLVPAYLLLILIFSTIYFLLYPQKTINLLYLMYKKTPFKYFVYFVLWIFISNTLLLLFNNISVPNYFSALLIILGCYFFLYYTYPAFLYYKFLNLHSIYKIIITAIFLIFVFGIIAHIGVIFSVKPIQFIQSILSNRQLIMFGDLYSTAKAKSVFFEAGVYGYFICLNIPLIISASKSKFKIYKNTYIDILVKKMMLPLTIISLLITKSPINLIFAIIIFSVYFILNNKKRLLNIQFLSKLISIIVLTILFIIFAFTNFQELPQIKRINTVITCIKNDFTTMVIYEPSLYSRMTSYVNQILLLKRHPILGVGLDQGKYIMHMQMENSPLPLTPELELLTISAFKTGKMIYNRNILGDILSETGIIGFILFYLYLFASVKSLNKAKCFYFNHEREIIESLKNTLIIIIFLSFYEMSIVQAPYHFLIFALSNVTVLIAKQKIIILRKAELK